MAMKQYELAELAEFFDVGIDTVIRGYNLVSTFEIL